MRHVGQAFFYIGHSPAAHNVSCACACCVVRLPKSGFIDPISLLQHLVRKAEGLKHLHGAAGDTVSLSQLQGPGLLVNDDRLNVRKSCQLRGQRQPSWPATHNHNISHGWQCTRTCTARPVCIGVDACGVA